MRSIVLVIASVLGACALDAELPEGRIACQSHADCPPNWSCRQNLSDDPGLCFRTNETNLDAGSRDGGHDAALPFMDSGLARLDGAIELDGHVGGHDASADADVPARDAAALDGSLDASTEAGIDASSNHAPTTGGLAIPKHRVMQGASISVLCNGSDPDGDTLSFLWSASGGSFANAALASTTYTASALGQITLACNLSDGRGGKAKATDTLNVYPTGLVALLPFSTDANDQSGQGHHGTVTGGVYGSDRLGNPSLAMQLDGNANVTLADPSAFDLPAFSFVATIKPEASNEGRTLVAKASTGFGSFTVFMYADNEGSLPRRLAVAQDNASDGSPYALVLGSYQPVLGSYIQLAVTRSDAGEVRAYVDGVQIHSSTGMPAAALNTAPVALGDGPLGGFVGVIDEVQIYQRALTAPEVQALVPLR